MKKINKRVMDSLVKAGALDSLGGHRASLDASLATAMKIAEQHRRDKDSGQNDMFGLIVTEQEDTKDEPLIEAEQWSEEQLLMAEKETLGLYLSGHPIDRYAQELARFIPKKISELDAPESKGYQRNEIPVTTAGLIVAIRTMKAKMVVVWHLLPWMIKLLVWKCVFLLKSMNSFNHAFSRINW